MKNVLLVEDDREISQLLNLHLQSELFQLNFCENGKDALDRILREKFNLVILDIMLPGLNGMEICKQVRKQDNKIPIIMLTARSDEADKVLALDLGADDYITKPFGILELIARAKALLRRAEQSDTAKENIPIQIQIKDIYINTDKRFATLKNERLDLTAKEFDLLVLLAGNPGKTFSRQEILRLVWGCAFPGYEHTVTAHINRLRVKIEPDLHKPQYILTTWGIGYRFLE